MDQLRDVNLGQTVVWATRSVKNLVRSKLPYQIVDPSAPPPSGLNTLIVVGGGGLIDEAKAWIRDQSPAVHLVAIPSSGEAVQKLPRLSF